jgi:hypothetical protein
MHAPKTDLLERSMRATVWCFILLVPVPVCWGLLGLLAARVSEGLGPVFWIPLGFYCSLPSLVFGVEHFNIHGGCLPIWWASPNGFRVDWVGVAQVVGFYTVVAAIAGVVVGTIRKRRHRCL